jgi:NADPH:quinone reductase-like Zn-dependent oxidoreductase
VITNYLRIDVNIIIHILRMFQPSLKLTYFFIPLQEFMGIVEEVGTEVHEVQQGDRVVLALGKDSQAVWNKPHR